MKRQIDVLFCDPHFFKEKAGIAEFVKDKHDVPDINRNGPLDIIVVLPVADHRLIVAIEYNTNDLALCIHDRAAAVPAGDICHMGKSDWHIFSHRIHPSSKIFILIKAHQSIGGVEWFFASVLIDNAFQRSEWVISDRVGRIIAAYRAVGEPHGPIGIRIQIAAFPLIQSFYIQLSYISNICCECIACFFALLYFPGTMRWPG
jgi:hypothetical protein